MNTIELNSSDRTPAPCVVELRETLKEVLGNNFVRLHHFGSRIMGGDAPDSDYDVLCVTKRPLNRREMNEVLDRRIDLHLLNHNVFSTCTSFPSMKSGRRRWNASRSWNAPSARELWYDPGRSASVGRGVAEQGRRSVG